VLKIDKFLEDSYKAERYYNYEWTKSYKWVVVDAMTYEMMKWAKRTGSHEEVHRAFWKLLNASRTKGAAISYAHTMAHEYMTNYMTTTTALQVAFEGDGIHAQD